ncbi:winged helix-turn-helix transcriptional regulator [Schumannella soli]|uniref:Helix-turn-helix transcriptional regulator n=1 Tax=Schumannella soli TaxID=2590779 RepID=A0A506YC34_9MICO|nr:helix-turn-helix domain-containing protein [Schumannella soli]TPW77989.1 helix-turn-helix transcriptional regulator [Schumannella soli]
MATTSTTRSASARSAAEAGADDTAIAAPLRESGDVHRCDAALVSAFGVLGKRWNGMILAVLGHQTLGFAELRRGIGAISDSMLSDRLGDLTGLGLIERQVDAGPPVSVTYRLTEAGCRLVPVLDQLGDWARDNLPRPEGH